MHQTGVRWFFADHPFILWRSGFSELHRYLMVKLWQDIDCDTDAVIREFTDHHYGAAGERMRQYIHELEQCRIDMELPPGIGEASYGVTYKSHTFDDRVFPYLTTENIRRWQIYFNQMDALTVDTPRPRLNLLGAILINFTPILEAQAPITEPLIAPPAGVTPEYGEYLVSYTCALCHGDDLGGDADFNVPSLIAVPLTWSEEDFLELFETGVTPSGRVVDGEQMPWEDLRALFLDDDLLAVYSHLVQRFPLPEN